MKALITGSGGLIGSECARVLCRAGWDVVGIDNDMRAQFFGPEGTTRPVVEELIAALPNYRHFSLDIRDRQDVRDLFRHERPDFIIHTAAQPSHDKAATIPYSGRISPPGSWSTTCRELSMSWRSGIQGRLLPGGGDPYHEALCGYTGSQ
jgi:NAD(P)-dependent dehydrogenase (short-subunit alcohol dehydrogenase family)